MGKLNGGKGGFMYNPPRLYMRHAIRGRSEHSPAEHSRSFALTLALPPYPT